MELEFLDAFDFELIGRNGGMEKLFYSCARNLRFAQI